MSKSKLPHMPLWVYDIEADESCRLMTAEQFGVYVRMLIRQWVEGSVPADTGALSILVGVPKRKLDGQFETVLSKFHPKADDPTRLINLRCFEERDNAVSKVEKNRQAGRKGGEANAKANAKANGTATASIHASGCGSESESSPEGGCGGKPIEAVLRRMKGRKQHIAEIAVNLDRDIDAVAWWAEVSRDSNVKQPLGMIRHRILEGEDAPRVTGQALCDAVRAGVVKTINGIDVTGDPPLHNNGVGLCRLNSETHTQVIIVPKDKLQEVRLG